MAKHRSIDTLAADEIAERETLRGVIRVINNMVRNSEAKWGYQDANGRIALRELKVTLLRNMRHPGEIRRDLRCSRSTP